MRRVRGRVCGESRGVALLTALVLVAIATAIAAAIFFDTGSYCAEPRAPGRRRERV